MNLTSANNYFEDFEVGSVIKHYRGKTIKESDAVTICNMVMNTAQGHFNDDLMRDTPIGESLVYGGVTISMTIGLAAQDTAEQVIREIGLNKIKLKSPVKHGDTLYAYSEVLSKDDTNEQGGGIVKFKHYGVNQNKIVVFEGERTVLLKKKNNN